MELFRMIVDDIRKKKNLDVYLTILISLTVTGLGVFQVVDLTVILSSILATLALVSMSLLVNRRDNEEYRLLQKDIESLTNHLHSLSVSDLLPVYDFSRCFQNVLGDQKEFDSIIMYAHTGERYYGALYDSKVKVKNLRILLRNMDDLSTMQIPISEGDKSVCRSQLYNAKLEFRRLKDEKKIGNISIAKYPFDPTFHFMIVGDKMLFGLYRPSAQHPGARFINFFIIRDDTVGGQQFINDSKKFFEETWLLSLEEVTK